MIIKPRHESLELKILRSLKARMNLSKKDESYYWIIEKGFIGEQKFDKWLENLSIDSYVLNDVLLEYNNTVFQIDTLLISPETIYIFDVKNYEGDFFIEADKWCTISRNEIKNPLLQLKRSENLFRQLLQDLGFTSTIETYLVFINSNFHLYQAPLNLPIIFPTQLNRFINQINIKSSNLKEKHSKFVKQLLSILLTESPYIRLPEYHYDQLKKGLTCMFCHSFINTFTKLHLVCNKCGKNEENMELAVLRSIEEFKILFPDRKITTNAIYDWCKIIKSKKIIRRILSTNFKIMGHGKSSFYVNRD